MDQDLRVAFDSPIEFVIRFWGLVESAFVRHDKRWLGAAADNQVTQVAIVCLDVALASTKRQTLLEQFTEG